jgi:hypothetical protein
MNIKTLYFICDKFFEKLHPNNSQTDECVSESEEDIDEIVEDITKDYEYLTECYKKILSYIHLNN